MSLPHDDDDENGRRPPLGGSSNSGIYPVKKLMLAAEIEDDDDDRTTAETSIGSASFSSDITSVIAGGAHLPGFSGSIPSTPTRSLHSTASEESPRFATGNERSGVDSNERIATRDRRRRQLQHLGIASGAAFALFIYVLIPTTLLLSMILFGGFSAAFVSRLVVYLQWEFQHSVLEGRGIGDYLPRSWYDLLTTSSLHDILSDPDGIFGVSEHVSYIMLYMVPGLTPEQRDQYVNRLSPIHQRLLQSEQGLLGYMHNRNRHHRTAVDEADSESSGLMRLLMGDQRLRQQQAQQRLPRRLELPPTIPEGTSWDYASEIGEPEADVSRTNPSMAESSTREEIEIAITRHPAAVSSSSALARVHGIPTSVTPIVGRAVVLNSSPVPAETDSRNPTPSSSNASPTNPTERPRPQMVRQSSVRRLAAAEEVVLFDALASGMANLLGEATQTIRAGARQSIRSVLGGPLFRASVGATMLGVGIGAYGLLGGAYDLNTLARPVFQLFTGTLFGGRSARNGNSTPRLPSSSLLVTSTLASGATAVVLGVFGWVQDTAKDSQDGDEEKDQEDAERANRVAAL